MERKGNELEVLSLRMWSEWEIVMAVVDKERER